MATMATMATMSQASTSIVSQSCLEVDTHLLTSWISDACMFMMLPYKVHVGGLRLALGRLPNPQLPCGWAYVGLMLRKISTDSLKIKGDTLGHVEPLPLLSISM